MIATVGIDQVGGIQRYTFGVTYLLAGIHFIPTILGFFAVSEVFIQAEKLALGDYKAPKVNLEFPSFAEFWPPLRHTHSGSATLLIEMDELSEAMDIVGGPPDFGELTPAGAQSGEADGNLYGPFAVEFRSAMVRG